jgi:hypothetical protein
VNLSRWAVEVRDVNGNVLETERFLFRFRARSRAVELNYRAARQALRLRAAVSSPDLPPQLYEARVVRG